MPDLRLRVTEEDLGDANGYLLKWNKDIGDWVRKNEELAVLQANSQQVSFKAPVQGVLQKIFIEPGQTFVAGMEIGLLRTVMGGT